MDDVCELDGICGGEMTQILDLGSDVKNNEIIKESLKESHPPFGEISNRDRFSVNLEKLNFEIHDENGGDAETAVSLRRETDPGSELAKVVALPATQGNNLFDGKISADAANGDEELTEAINKALEKHFDVGRDYEYVGNGRYIDNKEASVQTVADRTLVSNESCPICRLQRVELKSELTALCLEYPPYKKIKINKYDGLSGGTFETRFTRVSEYGSEDVEMERTRRRKVPFRDQVVPKSPSALEPKNDLNSESSRRSIRIGLSKRGKYRPLHQVPKFQASDPMDNYF